MESRPGRLSSVKRLGVSNNLYSVPVEALVINRVKKGGTTRFTSRPFNEDGGLFYYFTQEGKL